MVNYSVGEERMNAITHGLGTALAIAALVVLVVFAALYGTAWHIVSFSIYGSTLVMLYLASTLYHSFRKERVKKVLKTFDHSAIYLLIAGTYTPFSLVTLRGPWGWSIFGVVWGLAVTGVGLKIFFTGKFKVLSTLSYIFMGWLVVIAGKPLIEKFPSAGLFWLVAGGLFYTVGSLFYLWKKKAYTHAIWHLFVLAGSVCHFFAVLLYVLP